MASQRQIDRLAVVDRLGLGPKGTTETIKVSLGNAVIHHIHNAANRTIGVHQGRWAADDFNLLGII